MENKLAKVIIDTIWGDIDFYKDKSITNKKVLFISTSKYEYKERNYTESEINKLSNGCDGSKHLMSRVGYSNTLRGQKITTSNREFPTNCAKFIKKNLPKYDYIVVDYSYKLLGALQKFNIEYTVLLPSAFMKEEIIGHCFINGVSIKQLHTLNDSWCNWIHRLNSVCEDYGCQYYKLDNGENLTTVIAKI